MNNIPQGAYWAILIARYGFDFVIDLTTLLKSGKEPTAEDFMLLKQKYGTKTEEDYVNEAIAARQPH